MRETPAPALDQAHQRGQGEHCGNRPRIVGISGSERAGGNTEFALSYAGDLVRQNNGQFTLIKLREYSFSECGPCGDCNYRRSPCVIQDDMPALIDTLIGADGIIYATPVHGFGMAHLMQKFIERAGVGYLRFERPLTDKVGGIIVTCRRYGETSVYSQLVHNLMLNRMILVGSGFPAVLHGGKRGEVAQDTEGLSAVNSMVTRMLDMVHILKSGSSAVSLRASC